MKLERIKYILDNCSKFDKAGSKATKNIKLFEKKVKEYRWVVCDLLAKEREIKVLLEKMGFEEENGMRGAWWLYHEESNKTIKVSIAKWFNDYYGRYAGQFSYYVTDGKQTFHTLRDGETFYENGMMKTWTRRGVYTGD